MNPAVYERLAATEDRHWWFESRRRMVADVLARHGIARVASALDVGCGTGGMLEVLGHVAETVTGMDRSPLALRLAKEKHPGARLVEGDALRLRVVFPAERFDLVTYFNVLYHSWVEDKAAAAAEAFGVLRPGGHILLTEPAFPVLFREHDRVIHGDHRFRIPEIRRMLRDAGLVPSWSTYFNAVSFAPALGLAAVARIRRSVGAAPPPPPPDRDAAEMALPPPWLNRTMGGMMAVERALLRRGLRMPFGVSLLCLARRP